MKKEVKNKSASIRTRLMNIARTEGIEFDALLLRYFQERFLYRLSISKFSDYFILKGGLLLICFKMSVLRPTKDMDFLAEQIKNDIDDVKYIFAEIADIGCEDGVKFNSSSIAADRIKKDADYEGIRLKIDATLGQARKKMQMDIGFGDIVIPKSKIVEFPTLLDENPPKIRVYSIESIISEKFEAMIKFSTVNSRMKDFYDLYYLSNSNNFYGSKIKKAVESTFLKRKTPLPEDPLIFKIEFYENKERQKQWTIFIRKLRLYEVDQDFSKIMERIINFLKPILIAINSKAKINKRWNKATGSWEK